MHWGELIPVYPSHSLLKANMRSVNLVLIFNEVLGRLEVGSHHLLHKLIERHFTLPAQHFLGLGRVSVQELDLRRAEVARVDAHNSLAGLLVNANFIDTRSLPSNLDIDTSESLVDILADWVSFARCQDEVFRLLLL